MPLQFNPLDALNERRLFDLFVRMLSHRYRTDILIDYYHLPNIPLRFNWRGAKITPEEMAQKELHFLRERNAGNLRNVECVVEEFWQELCPQGDHLSDHLETEAKYNDIALQASDVKLIKPLFYLFPDHRSLDIVDIGAGRNRLGRAIKKHFDDLHERATYFNWLDNLGGIHTDLPDVRITGTDVTDWKDDGNDVTGVDYRLQPTPTTLNIEDASRDVVITKWTFHHMTHSQIDCQIQNIFRILRPGGVVIVIEAFATNSDALPPEDDSLPEPTFVHRLLEISRRIEFADIWPQGPWKEHCFKITRDYLNLSCEDQRRLLALEDFMGHFVLNRRDYMPFPFSYLPAEELIWRFKTHGFQEQRWNFLMFGQAPIIRRGPPSARFMFEKPRPS